jgi:hypothetical protein
MNFRFHLSHGGVINLKVVWIQLKMQLMHAVLQLSQKWLKKDLMLLMQDLQLSI